MTFQLISFSSKSPRFLSELKGILFWSIFFWSSSSVYCLDFFALFYLSLFISCRLLLSSYFLSIDSSFLGLGMGIAFFFYFFSFIFSISALFPGIILKNYFPKLTRPWSRPIFRDRYPDSCPFYFRSSLCFDFGAWRF